MNISCAKCSKKVDLKQCSVCKVVYYCGRECQAAHHATHKINCKCVKIGLAAVKSKEKLLIEEFNAENVDVFTEMEGNFWGYHETRPYMRSRFSLFTTYSRMNTPASVREALLHGRDMLRLCRGDNLGVRQFMISLYLRTNTYKGMQDGYDFLKWWDTCDPDGHYDWGNMELPYLNIVGADMLEAPYPELLHKYASIYNVVCATLIKMRLLIQLNFTLSDLDTLFLSTIRSTSPMVMFRGNQGVLSTVGSFLRPSFPCFTTKKLAELRALQEALRQQVKQLMDHVENNLNNRIWKAIINPYKVMTADAPEGISAGSSEEAIEVVKSFLLIFLTRTREAEAMRQILIDRVGPEPDYDMEPRNFGRY